MGKKQPRKRPKQGGKGRADKVFLVIAAAEGVAKLAKDVANGLSKLGDWRRRRRERWEGHAAGLLRETDRISAEARIVRSVFVEKVHTGEKMDEALAFWEEPESVILAQWLAATWTLRRCRRTRVLKQAFPEAVRAIRKTVVTKGAKEEIVEQFETLMNARQALHDAIQPRLAHPVSIDLYPLSPEEPDDQTE